MRTTSVPRSHSGDVWHRQSFFRPRRLHALTLAALSQRFECVCRMQGFDEKNIRRRVYDALNVLMSMDVISRERKEIRWNGLPSSATEELANLKVSVIGVSAFANHVSSLQCCVTTYPYLSSHHRYSVCGAFMTVAFASSNA